MAGPAVFPGADLFENLSAGVEHGFMPVRPAPRVDCLSGELQNELVSPHDWL